MENQTIGEIVAKNFKTASVFKNHGIDFCCGGKKKIGEACIEAGISKETLLGELYKANEITVSSFQDFNNWDLDFLCDYIRNTHHKFVRENLSDLKFYTQKIAAVHGSNHHELNEIAGLFARIYDELTMHMEKEEKILFPAISIALNQPSNKISSTITGEISRMFDEHEFAGGAMDEINRLSNGYIIPDDGCKTYEVTYKLLSEFEDNLHIHVHLENNILFPKALKLVSSISI